MNNYIRLQLIYFYYLMLMFNLKYFQNYRYEAAKLPSKTMEFSYYNILISKIITVYGTIVKVKWIILVKLLQQCLAQLPLNSLASSNSC